MQVDDSTLGELATEQHSGEEIVKTLLQFGQDMDEIGRDELVEEVRRFGDD